MEWNDDMTLAPREAEWVLGAIPYEGENISEVVIFDNGMWTDTRGVVVHPVAWARIEPYAPAHDYDWEGDAVFAELLDEVNEMLPIGFVATGLAVGNVETGEGALITDPNPDKEMALWEADVAKDVAYDSGKAYDKARAAWQSHFSD